MICTSVLVRSIDLFVPIYQVIMLVKIHIAILNLLTNIWLQVDINGTSLILGDFQKSDWANIDQRLQRGDKTDHKKYGKHSYTKRPLLFSNIWVNVR